MKNRKITALIISLLLVLVLGVGATVAYMFVKTEQKQNVFPKAFVSCEVLEEFDGETKKDVKIKNTGNTEAYIRAKIIVSWAKDDSTVSSSVPKKDEDYLLTLADGNWIECSDGYFYYKKPVSAQGETEVLIASCTLKDTASVPEGCHLSVEIVASALQSRPENVVTTTWGITLANGEIVKG